MTSRRQQLRSMYGFDFPDDLFRFWEFANRVRPLEPLSALYEVLDVRLVGPFEVLAGRFDGRTPQYSPLLHYRYSTDPPEFFTALLDDDGLHWGYYLDDPAARSGCVASYYPAEVFELSHDGDDLFQAMRLQLEARYCDCQEYREKDPAHAPEYDEALRRADRLRDALTRYATADRPETGEDYEEKYSGATRRYRRVVAETLEGMGIVVHPELYRRLSLGDGKLWAHLRKTKDPARVVEEARQALRDGFPGTALKLGKDLWAFGGEKKTEYAYELLDAAYSALNREALRRVLQTHRADRDLPSVDVLDPDL